MKRFYEFSIKRWIFFFYKTLAVKGKPVCEGLVPWNRTFQNVETLAQDGVFSFTNRLLLRTDRTYIRYHTCMTKKNKSSDKHLSMTNTSPFIQIIEDQSS
jgi:hypothetical protein